MDTPNEGETVEAQVVSAEVNNNWLDIQVESVRGVETTGTDGALTPSILVNSDGEELDCCDDEPELVNTSTYILKQRLSEDDEIIMAKTLQWKKQQDELKDKVQLEDSSDVKSWKSDFSGLHYVAGVDISFEKENPSRACATLVILSYPDMKVIMESSEMVEVTEPYIPGFLAFREEEHLFRRLDDLKRSHPHLRCQVIFVDGNGILHPNRFGLACHLGVRSDLPCIGVAKKLHLVDGLQNDMEHKHKIHSMLNKKGSYFELIGISGCVLATVVRTSDEATNPVYVSVGHKISLETATMLTVACSRKRVPEPVRMADLLSRRYLREEKKLIKK